MKFSIKDFFSNWSHLKNFIFLCSEYFDYHITSQFPLVPTLYCKLNFSCAIKIYKNVPQNTCFQLMHPLNWELIIVLNVIPLWNHWYWSLFLLYTLLHKNWSFPLRIFSANVTKSMKKYRKKTVDLVTFTEEILIFVQCT